MLIRTLELGAIALFIVAFLSQILFPLALGQPLFPALRRRRQQRLERTENDLRASQRALEDAKKRREAAEQRAQAARLDGETERIDEEAHEARMRNIERRLTERGGGDKK